MGIVLAVEEVAGNVARVDRLDQQVDVGVGGLLRRPLEVLQVGRPERLARAAGGHQPGHHVDPGTGEDGGVLEGAVDAAAKLGLAAGQAGQAALAAWRSRRARR
jgi:hypothetical protein